MKFATLIVVIVLLAFLLGSVLLADRPEPSYQVQAAQDSTAITRAKAAAAWAWGWVAFRGAIALVIAGAVGGLALALVRWANKRAGVIYPDKAGLYPLIRGRAREIIVDPNRAPSGVIVIGNLPVPALPEPTEAGAATTARAQAAQLVAAATRDGGAGRAMGRMLENLTGRREPLGLPFPNVQVSTLEPSHVERLLLESGEVGDYEQLDE